MDNPYIEFNTDDDGTPGKAFVIGYGIKSFASTVNYMGSEKPRTVVVYGMSGGEVTSVDVAHTVEEVHEKIMAYIKAQEAESEPAAAPVAMQSTYITREELAELTNIKTTATMHFAQFTMRGNDRSVRSVLLSDDHDADAYIKARTELWRTRWLVEPLENLIAKIRERATLDV